jgi:hypothetical protein
MFYNKYLKYKYKYLSLKNKLNQKGGADISDLDKIMKIYKTIPPSGIHNEDLDEALKEFNLFCSYLLENSSDKVVAEIELIEKLKKEGNEEEVKKLNKQKGDEIKDMGAKYEDDVFKVMNKIISEKTKLDDIKILKNHTLYQITKTKKGDISINIGEIDAIIVDENNNLVAICEIKSSFDGIPDALYQAERTLKKIIENEAERTLKKIIENENDNIYLEDENKDKVDLPKFGDSKGSLLNNIFIFSKFDENTQYFNFPGSFKHGLLNALVTRNKKDIPRTKEKIFNRIKKKQFIQGRYTKDVITTLEEFKKEGLLDHVQIVD